MKKFFLLSIIAVVFFASSKSQSVGINNDGSVPHASAMLDVKSANKGLLIPRVTLTGTNDISTVPVPAKSLLIYNTDSNGVGATAVIPGFYYWNGSVWANLRSSTGSGSGGDPGSAWLLTGNAGTADGTNFIGTTDNVPFNVRVNNQKAGRIDNALANTFWGYQAGKLNTTGTYNTVSGHQALSLNTTGNGNTANGYQALYSNTLGDHNTATGFTVSPTANSLCHW
jgi:hypothetical protein